LYVWRLYKKLWRGTVFYEGKSKLILFQTNYEHRDLYRNFSYTCFWDLLDSLWLFIGISNKKTTMHNSHFPKLFLEENSSEVLEWSWDGPDQNPIEIYRKSQKIRQRSEYQKNFNYLEEFMMEKCQNTRKFVLIDILKSMRRCCKLIIEIMANVCNNKFFFNKSADLKALKYSMVFYYNWTLMINFLILIFFVPHCNYDEKKDYSF